MPEMNFRVRWPDGAESVCYSPSRIVAQHLDAATSYDLPDFVARSRAALSAASERVRAHYGVPCARALGQLTEIERTAARFGSSPNAAVIVLTIDHAVAVALQQDESS